MVKYIYILVLLFEIQGCASKGEEEVVFIKCKTPDIAKPAINNYSSGSSSSDKIRVLYNNYIIMKEYAIALKKANEVCK
jgi:hypothetical protein